MPVIVRCVVKKIPSSVFFLSWRCSKEKREENLVLCHPILDFSCVVVNLMVLILAVSHAVMEEKKKQYLLLQIVRGSIIHACIIIAIGHC